MTRTLEYAYDDFAIYQMGKALGRPNKEARLYAQRSQNYRKLFDKSVSLMRGRNQDGSWYAPFNPFKWGGDFTEGNSWHYTWSVIHEIREMQVANMGQYAHGNQPAQHISHLYAYAGQPWKTQYWVRGVLDRRYHPTPDGYCGDEDNGQTSAWYVFSALGFYPVCPATDQYVLGAPLFPKAILHLASGHDAVLNAPASSPANRYLTGLTLSGQFYSHN